MTSTSILYRDLLDPFIRFKSISTDLHYQDQVKATAAWLANLFEKHGHKVTVFSESKTASDNPLVLAEIVVDPKAPTCLVYGHYDVQPAHKKDGWDTEPFEVAEKSGKLLARGIVDNKGQTLIHIATVLQLAAEGKLKYNVKFFMEGNEETGSPSLEGFVRGHIQDLRCDFVMVSDGEVSGGHPIIDAGFRGGFNSTLTVRTGTTALHSGIYGGAAPNAAHVLARFVGALFDEQNRVALPGFYDNVDPIDETLLAGNRKIPFDMKEWTEYSGNRALVMEPGYDINTQVGLRPTIQVTGLLSGYVDDGYLNAIPEKAAVKINFRLVKSQVVDQVAEDYRKYVRSQLPAYVDFDLDIGDPHDGMKLDLSNRYIDDARTILRDVWKKEPLLKYSGGGLPIVTYFQSLLNVPQVLIPLANEDCRMHAVHENFRLDHLERGLEFSRRFFGK